MDYREEAIRNLAAMLERGDGDESTLHEGLNYFSGEPYVTILAEQLGLLTNILTGLDALFVRAPYPTAPDEILRTLAHIHTVDNTHREAYKRSVILAVEGLATHLGDRYFSAVCDIYRVSPASVPECHHPMMDTVATAFAAYRSNLKVLVDGVSALSAAVTAKRVNDHDGIVSLHTAFKYTPRDADLTVKCLGVMGQLCDVDFYGHGDVVGHREEMKACGMVAMVIEIIATTEADFVRNAALRALSRYIGNDEVVAEDVRARLNASPAAANLLVTAAAAPADNSEAMREFLKATVWGA